MRAADPEWLGAARRNEMAAARYAVDQPVRIGVLYNPLSGKNRQAPGLLPRIISGYPQVLLKEIRTPREVHDALVDFAGQGINLIVISGGDGTVQATLTVLFTGQPFIDPPATCRA